MFTFDAQARQFGTMRHNERTNTRPHFANLAENLSVEATVSGNTCTRDFCASLQFVAVILEEQPNADIANAVLPNLANIV